MTKEVMKQALDALIDSLDLVANVHAEAVELYSTYTSQQARIVGLKRELDAHEAAIKALEAAIAQPVQLTAQSMQEYGDARVQAYKTARQAEQGSPPAWMQNIDVAMQEPLFQALRGMMGTENIGQDIALLQTIRHYRAISQPVQPTYGCVMVPVDPTPEMLDSGANCAEYCHQNVYESDAEKIYAAMIAAAPQAIAQPVSNIAFLYEELRKATDGGSESMAHDDALAQIKYWSDMAAIAQPVQPAQWQPLTSAPKDGAYILLGSTDGAWVARFHPVYQSGYRPENPWQSMMLNHEHLGLYPKAKPTHWMPLPLSPDKAKIAQPVQPKETQ